MNTQDQQRYGGGFGGHSAKRERDYQVDWREKAEQAQKSKKPDSNLPKRCRKPFLQVGGCSAHEQRESAL